jgi:hypothetical protein
MKYIFLFLLFTNFVTAQNLDSLYNAIVSLQGHEHSINEQDQITSSSAPGKCGFTTIADAKKHFNYFTIEQQNRIQKILSRPDKQTSIVSPSGYFRIHYDTTGSSTPNYFIGEENNIQLSVDSLAIAFDSSYNFEVNILGYDPPPSDDGDGGDDLYDVYISYLGTGMYGLTDWVVGNNGNKSFIEVDCRMDNFTKGIHAARATAAHEFHHAIQVGTYSDNLDGNSENGNRFYFELTSTAMEEFVYDSVNDYYGYLYGYFNNPDRRFTYFVNTGNAGGYDRAIWNIFLKEKFEQEGSDSQKGFDIIKRSWELMRNNQNTAMESISLALSENGLSLKNTFAEFAQWAYYTGYRAKENKYFSEGMNYPLIKPNFDYTYQAPKKTYEMNSNAPMSNNFILFDLSSSGINDTLFSIITNCDIANADLSPYKTIDYDYSLLTYGEDNSNNIVTGYYSKIESNSMEFLKESNIFNNEIVNGTTILREEIDYAYPQPFNQSKNSYVFFPTKTNEYGTAKLSIYSTSMNLVYNDNHEIYNNEKIVIRWDGKGNNGNKVASGIYLFVTDSDGEIIKGKLAIIK